MAHLHKNTGRSAVLHLGCMKTAKVFRLTPAAAGDEALRTKCGVAHSSPPEWICIDSPTCSSRQPCSAHIWYQQSQVGHDWDARRPACYILASTLRLEADSPGTPARRARW